MGTLLWLLLARIAVGAGLLVVHIALLLRAARARDAPAWVRWLALVPPLAPLVGLRVGARPAAYAWCLLVATYIALWYRS